MQNSSDFNLLDVMVAIGERYATVERLKSEEKEKVMCSVPDCIENAKCSVDFEDEEEKIYLCDEHFSYVKVNTYAYAVDNILDGNRTKEIPVIVDKEKKINVSYLGKVNDIVKEAEADLKDMGILEDSEPFDIEIFLTALRSTDGIAYADVINDMVFAYALDSSNDEYILTEKEWKEILERLGAADHE